MIKKTAMMMPNCPLTNFSDCYIQRIVLGCSTHNFPPKKGKLFLFPDTLLKQCQWAHMLAQQRVHVLISAPTRSIIVGFRVRLFVWLSAKLRLCFRTDSSHFFASASPSALLQNVASRFSS